MLQTMKVKSSIIKKIKESKGARKEIMKALKISRVTLHKYLTNNSENLTKAAAMKAIGDYFNLTAEEILAPEKKIAA